MSVKKPRGHVTCIECKGTGVCRCPFCEGSCTCGFLPECHFCDGKGHYLPYPYTWNQSAFRYTSRAEKNELVLQLRAFIEKHKLSMRVVIMRKAPVVKIVCKSIKRNELPYDHRARKFVDPGQIYAAIWARYRILVGERSDIDAVRNMICAQTSSDRPR